MVTGIAIVPCDWNGGVTVIGIGVQLEWWCIATGMTQGRPPGPP